MQDPKNNYVKIQEQPLCPLREKEDDTTEHALQWRRDEDRKQRNIKDNTDEEWEDVVQIFKENKRRREKKTRESLGRKKQFK